MYRYAIALGSNRRTRHGAPAATLCAALAWLVGSGVVVDRVSAIVATPAMGPAGRGFANAAATIATPLSPPALLALLKRCEHDFGRRPGRRWGPRPLDLDILLWSGGRWPRDRGTRAIGLRVPHVGLDRRRFVLDPLVTIAPGWCLPGTATTIRQLHARLARAIAVDPRRRRP